MSEFREQKERPKSVEVAKAAETDWEQYKELRLKGLQTDPTAFGRTYEEESARSDADWKKQISDPYFQVFIAREGAMGAGIVGLRFSQTSLQHHLVKVGPMYVDPQFRRHHVGEALMKAALDEARKNPAITKVKLSVNTTQEAAFNLYKKLGFVQTGVEHNEIKIGDRYIDQIQMELIFSEKL